MDNEELDFARSIARKPEASDEELAFAQQIQQSPEPRSLGRKAWDAAVTASKFPARITLAQLESGARLGRAAKRQAEEGIGIMAEKGGLPGALAGTAIGTAADLLIPTDKPGVALTLLGGEKASAEAAQVVGKVAKPVMRVARKAGRVALERATSLFSGIPPEAWEILSRYPEAVAEMARKGMTHVAETGKPIANAMLKAQELGIAAQEKLGKAAEGAGKMYSAMMEHLKRDRSGVRFPRVAQDVFDRMEPYIESQTAYRDPVMSKATKEAAEEFNHFYARIKSTLQEGMSPGEAASLLQQMSDTQAANISHGVKRPIVAHLEELKQALLDALPGEYRIPTIDTPTPGGWPIRGTRAEYRAAKELQREAAPFAKAQAPVTAFSRMAAQGGKVGRALKKAVKRIPGFAEDISGMVQAKAGAEFAPGFSQNLPRTGLTGGAMLLVAKAFKNPAAMLQVPLVALGVSPRLAMETYLAAGKGTAALEAFMARNASKFPPAIMAAYNASTTGEWPEDFGAPK